MGLFKVGMFTATQKKIRQTAANADALMAQATETLQRVNVAAEALEAAANKIGSLVEDGKLKITIGPWAENK